MKDNKVVIHSMAVNRRVLSLESRLQIPPEFRGIPSFSVPFWSKPVSSPNVIGRNPAEGTLRESRHTRISTYVFRRRSWYRQPIELAPCSLPSRTPKNQATTKITATSPITLIHCPHIIRPSSDDYHIKPTSVAHPHPLLSPPPPSALAATYHVIGFGLRRQRCRCQVHRSYHTSPNQQHLPPPIYAMIIPPSIERWKCMAPTSFIVSSNVVTTSSFVLLYDTTNVYIE